MARLVSRRHYQFTNEFSPCLRGNEVTTRGMESEEVAMEEVNMMLITFIRRQQLIEVPQTMEENTFLRQGKLDSQLFEQPLPHC